MSRLLGRFFSSGSGQQEPENAQQQQSTAAASTREGAIKWLTMKDTQDQQPVSD